MPYYPELPWADQSLVQARRTTTFTLGTSFADIDLDTTDIENDDATIEQIAADQIEVKVDGKYEISYGVTAPAGTYVVSFQVRKNDTSVLPGSEAVGDGNGSNISRQFIADLVIGDYITLQAKVDTGTPALAAGLTLTITHLAGQKGDKGDASATDVDAIHDNVGAEISLIAEKTTPASADLLIIEDSAATYIKKKLQVGNLPSGATLSDTAPVNVTKAAASAGVATQASRQDHKHDATTAAPPAGAVAVGNAVSEGAATSLARSDHQHQVTKGTPTDVGAANAAGSATTFVASDHVHAGLTRGAADFNSFTVKATPVAADLLLIEDSAAANAKKKITVGSLLSGYGQDYQSAVSEANSTTTSATFQSKTTLTTGALTGTYLVKWQCEISIGTANTRHQCRLYNSTDATELCFDDTRPSLLGMFTIRSGFALVTFAGAAKTLILQFASQGGVATVTIRRARITLWRVA